MSVEEKSVERVKRMLDRWSGIQGPLRSGKEIFEGITSAQGEIP